MQMITMKLKTAKPEATWTEKEEFPLSWPFKVNGAVEMNESSALSLQQGKLTLLRLN